jgi:hypothetical protein
MRLVATVWAALAMRIGGGVFDPDCWKSRCRSQGKRIRITLDANGPANLRSEPSGELKCFHAACEAKQWLNAARGVGLLDGRAAECTPGHVLPFVELTSALYARELASNRVLQSLGCYHIFLTT